MDKLLNQDLGNILEVRSVLIAVVGFCLAYIELLHHEKARYIQERMHELTSLEQIFYYIRKKECNHAAINKILKKIFKENDDIALALLRLSLFVIVFSMFLWFFLLISLWEMFFVILFSPLISFFLTIGGAPIFAFFWAKSLHDAFGWSNTISATDKN